MAPVAPAEIVVGGTVNVDTAREINRDILHEQHKANKLRDGTFMVIDCERPLPEPFHAEVDAEVDAKAETVSGDSVSWV